MGGGLSIELRRRRLQQIIDKSCCMHNTTILISFIYMSSACSNYGGLAITKHTWDGWRADGMIVDLGYNSNANEIVVLTQKSAAVLNLQTRQTKSNFGFPSSFNPKIIFDKVGSFEILSRGGGFSPVFMVKNGEERLRISNGVFGAGVKVADGVSTEKGARMVLATGVGLFDCIAAAPVLIEKGNFSDVFYSPDGSFWVTIQRQVGRKTATVLQMREVNSESLKSMPVSSKANHTVAVNWPSTNTVAYLTDRDLVFADFVIKTENVLKLSKGIMFGQAATFRLDNEFYLAIIVAFRPGIGGSELYIVSPELKILFRQSLSLGFGLCSLPSDRPGVSRLIVGSGSRIEEFTIRSSESPVP